MRQRNLPNLRRQRRVYGLYEGGFSHAGLAREQTQLAAAGLPQVVDSLACLAGCLDHLVSRTFVDAPELIHRLWRFPAVQIHLVQRYQRRNLVDLAGEEYAVQERQFDFWEKQADGNYRLVQVRGDYMCLPAQIGRFADHVVPPRQNFGNDRSILRGGNALCGAFSRNGLRSNAEQRAFSIPAEILHLIADRDRIGGRGFLQTDLPAQNCGERLPRRKLAKQIMTARILYNRRNPLFHSYLALLTSFSAKRLSTS